MLTQTRRRLCVVEVNSQDGIILSTRIAPESAARGKR